LDRLDWLGKIAANLVLVRDRLHVGGGSRRMDFLLKFFLGLLEFTQAPAQAARQLRDLVRTEQNDETDQDIKPLRPMGQTNGKERMRHKDYL